jgi:hypothetical protein
VLGERLHRGPDDPGGAEKQVVDEPERGRVVPVVQRFELGDDVLGRARADLDLGSAFERSLP